MPGFMSERQVTRIKRSETRVFTWPLPLVKP